MRAHAFLATRWRGSRALRRPGFSFARCGPGHRRRSGPDSRTRTKSRARIGERSGPGTYSTGRRPGPGASSCLQARTGQRTCTGSKSADGDPSPRQ